MSTRKTVVMPQTRKYLEQMDEQIKLAGLRRKLSAELVAERADILWSVAKGSPSVAIGTYAAVLHSSSGMVLSNMGKDLLLIAKDD